MRQTPRLSKSRFLAGLQCHKRLYLECYAPELATPPAAGLQAIFDSGTRVGEYARERYPGGCLISEDYLHQAEARRSTRRALDDPSVTSIYEAAFLHDDVGVRVDILDRVIDDEFDLIEVKSSTIAKDEHLFDLGIQLYVLEGCGIRIRQACLLHLDSTYVYPGGEYDLERLFRLVDLTEACRALQEVILDELEAMREALALPIAPGVLPGRHCGTPYPCPFVAYCSKDGPEHPLTHLPGVRSVVIQQLMEEGIFDIREIPDEYDGLTWLQKRVRDSVISGEPFLDPAISEALGHMTTPIHFLDFETFNPALPLYAGTHPYQVMPFQWSDHVLGEDGAVHHHEFLHDGYSDPRIPFAQSLLRVLGRGGSIVVYSSYEAARLRELALALPEMGNDLLGAVERMVDILPLIRQYCYHPGFGGSFSIKAVLPALAPHLSYKDLEIAEGGAASAAFAQIVDGTTSPEQRSALRAALLAYCERDTLAMLELFRTLR